MLGSAHSVATTTLLQTPPILQTPPYTLSTRRYTQRAPAPHEKPATDRHIRRLSVDGERIGKCAFHGARGGQHVLVLAGQARDHEADGRLAIRVAR